MAKSVSPEEAVLEGLRKAIQALPATVPLSGTKGLFPQKDGKGKELSDLAIAEGFLTLRQEAVKKKKVDHGVITDKGIHRILEIDGPKAALEALLPAVQALGKQPDAPNPGVFRAELARAAETCVNAIKESFDKVEGQILKALTPCIAHFEGELLKALPTSSAAPVDPGMVLRALHDALGRVEAPKTPVPIPATPSVVPAKAVEDDIVAFVNGWAKEKTVGCQFDVLWNHLHKQHPHLTIGAFQDALRKVHDSHRIRLGGWAQMLDDMPQPQLGLFISSKVMYYAHPSQANG